MFSNKRVLLVEAHPDDLVWGCGGTLAKFKEAEKRFQSQFQAITFTSCEEDPLNKGILQENREALNFLGVTDILRPRAFDRRTLYLHAQEIRDTLHRIKKEYCPEVVFSVSPSDLHQDHSIVGECCKTIFRESTHFTYPILRSLGTYFKPMCFVVLSKEQMTMKLKALSMFKTQYRRPYFKKKVVLSEATYYGTQINAEYAEAFEIMELIV